MSADADMYPWIRDMDGPLPPTAPLFRHIPAPRGFHRVPAGDGSFAAWLRGLPVRLDRTAILTHDGRRLARPAHAIVLLDVGEANRQQCADTALRLHAEYLWQAGRRDAIAYHFTNGDRSSWQAWQRGERFRVRGRRVQRYRTGSRPATHAELRNYLDHLFRYASTRSLALDSRPVEAHEPLAAGDVFVQPGSPGHAIMVLDIAVAPDGRQVGLLGQGYMPAQELHVIPGVGGSLSPWIPLPQGSDELLVTPVWSPFRRDEVRRFVAGSG